MALAVPMLVQDLDQSGQCSRWAWKCSLNGRRPQARLPLRRQTVQTVQTGNSCCSLPALQPFQTACNDEQGVSARVSSLSRVVVAAVRGEVATQVGATCLALCLQQPTLPPVLCT